MSTNGDVTPADQVLERLRDVARSLHELDRARSQYVQLARRARCTWAEIGSALGVSAQAAQKRFGGPR